MQESATPDQATEATNRELTRPKVPTEAKQEKISSTTNPVAPPESSPEEPSEPFEAPQEGQAAGQVKSCARAGKI